MNYETGVWVISGVAILLGSIAFLTYVKIQEKRRYNALSPIEKLWDDYLKLNALSPAGQTVAKRLEACLVAEMMAASTKEELREMQECFMDGSFSQAFFWSRPGSSLQKVFLEKMSEFETKEAQQAISEKNRLKEILQVEMSASQTAAEMMSLHQKCSDSDIEIQTMKKWDTFSLKDVLTAKTTFDLSCASKTARSGSLASKFVPFMHEKLSKRDVEEANDVDDIVEAAESAPAEAFLHNTALYIAFLKLHARHSHRNL